MAKTAKGTKYVRVAGYKTSSGTKVRGHVRSTPSKRK